MANMGKELAMATILLVDDDVDLVEMNKLVLVSRGHDVQEAYSAAEARALLEKAPPDIAVIDVMMESDSAGFELARQLHAMYPDVPALILTSVHEARELPFRFGPDETYLPVMKVVDKPLPPKRLAEEIEAALGKR